MSEICVEFGLNEICMFRKVKVPELLDNPLVLAVAEKHKKTSGQVLLRFLAQQGVVVLAKSVSEQRIKSNFEVKKMYKEI